MTKAKATQLAKTRIKSNAIYLRGIEKYEKENPNHSENQLGAKISKLVIKMIFEL
ncbi:hypothetical protein YTPLAS73_09700 [Nitrosarchaeum sp.]|nr:hypothetical protein YTPLAS73_09700 [Nitrosarchaeum sp.]